MRRALPLNRRSAIFGAAAMAAFVSSRGDAAPDKNAPPAVALFCDPTLASAMRKALRLFTTTSGAPVVVLSAPPSLMLAQMERNVRADVLITLTDVMDDADRRGLIETGSRFGGLRNRLVLAVRADSGVARSNSDPASLAGMIAKGRLAIPDATVAAAFSGPAVLDRIGLAPALLGKVLGAANTLDVASMLKDGSADFGLVYQTDVRADSALSVGALLSLDAAQTSYSFALSKKAKSPKAQAMLDFIRDIDAPVLQASGLEVAT